VPSPMMSTVLGYHIDVCVLLANRTYACRPSSLSGRRNMCACLPVRAASPTSQNGHRHWTSQGVRLGNEWLEKVPLLRRPSPGSVTQIKKRTPSGNSH